MKQIYILRHGESIANSQLVVSGSLDSPITDLGRRQSEIAGRTAAQFFRFDLVVTSPMLRARQTAGIVADKMGYAEDKILVVDDLRERDLGGMEGKSYAATPQYNGNYEDVEETPGLEPIEQLHARVKRVLQDMHERPEQKIVLVCHNGVGRMLRVVAAGLEPLAMHKEPRLSHAVFYEI